ncbi:MAG: hypothetical protein ACRC5C_13620, partial [Bacilli bacterium]
MDWRFWRYMQLTHAERLRWDFRSIPFLVVLSGVLLYPTVWLPFKYVWVACLFLSLILRITYNQRMVKRLANEAERLEAWHASCEVEKVEQLRWDPERGVEWQYHGQAIRPKLSSSENVFFAVKSVPTRQEVHVYRVDSNGMPLGHVVFSYSGERLYSVNYDTGMLCWARKDTIVSITGVAALFPARVYYELCSPLALIVRNQKALDLYKTDGEFLQTISPPTGQSFC